MTNPIKDKNDLRYQEAVAMWADGVEEGAVADHLYMAVSSFSSWRNTADIKPDFPSRSRKHVWNAELTSALTGLLPDKTLSYQAIAKTLSNRFGLKPPLTASSISGKANTLRLEGHDFPSRTTPAIQGMNAARLQRHEPAAGGFTLVPSLRRR